VSIGTFRQAATLHQIEAYHTSMKQEIAVTRRATYKAEESIQNLEKEKGQQDSLIDKLQETLKSLHQQAALVTAQVVHPDYLCSSHMDTLVFGSTCIIW
jgi:chromosome segregation ATPase